MEANLLNSIIMSKGLIITGQASTQAAQVVHCHKASGEVEGTALMMGVSNAEFGLRIPRVAPSPFLLLQIRIAIQPGTVVREELFSFFSGNDPGFYR